ncbi:NADPH-dependent 7-cyano-7-deazaguanine reductase QueF [Psychromonas sp. 14N.309.X.WAT.B.A12]|uniref:NADPH-dependent 7-cyano-7-deazaguanine reductase QueF n=1 Tax=unclassified Psychromonas TaxID=2614957 RepID=UPI0025B1E1EE|nr:NADPH-dependent 7-cyano-7-deazaguanine reductase QueF [Psychromonas sp. 14N.309.X.WAT.B.A12]MDN2663005.1 NADPH-dependent 7-cyano-7-deazaguanine reductase QueF [Psychromonas sp. 14N.309.X.WAT.B.A12]
MSHSTLYDHDSALKDLSLGKITEYKCHYDNTLLQGVPRSLNRNELSLEADSLPFYGVDLWNIYELSWLNSKGKPIVATGVVKVPYNSEFLIESKSFKLYLNSFNQSKFDSVEEVQTILSNDLSACAKKPVEVTLNTKLDKVIDELGALSGINIDELDIEVDQYQLSPSLLNGISLDDTVTETLHSNLLKSNCLITSQPDWGSVEITYTGKRLDHEKLLRYLISFRQHNEFHEQCVERIFCDLMAHGSLSELTVYARYTRRGGLDINPLRSTCVLPEIHNIRLVRQ